MTSTSHAAPSRRLLLLGAGVVADVFMLLVLAFGRSRDALLIMIGFITLFDIATRNGIMLVSHIQHLMREEGVTDFRDAVERGGLMTSTLINMVVVPTMYLRYGRSRGAGIASGDRDVSLSLFVRTRVSSA